jgi:4-hydroxybenzoate polyprenyltransferase
MSGYIDTETYLVLIGATLLFSGAYYINQIYDYESDLINKKLGFLQKGVIKRREMTAAYISVSVLGLVSGFAVSYKIGIVFSLIFILGFLYSAPPVRLKDRPSGGFIANALAYGILLPMAIPGSLNQFNINTLLVPSYFFLAVSATYVLTIIPDRDGDIKTGKRTLAAFYSNRVLISFGIILLILSARSAFLMENYYLLSISGVSVFVFLVALITAKMKLIFFACKFPVLLISLLAGYYYPVYLIFLVVLILLTRLYYKKRFGVVYPRID